MVKNAAESKVGAEDRTYEQSRESARARPFVSSSSQKSQRAGIKNFALMVHCPSQDKVVSVEGCSGCGFCDGLVIDTTDKDTFLSCRAPVESLAAKPTPEFLSRPELEVSGTMAPDDVPISELMSAGTICVYAETSLEELTQLFMERGISGVPVISAEQRAIGIVSKTDLIRELYESHNPDERSPLRIEKHGYSMEIAPGLHLDTLSRRCVSDIMTPIPLALPATASVARAAALMSYEGVHRLVVLAQGGAVLGVLSSMDVLRWLSEQMGYILPAHAKVARGII